MKFPTNRPAYLAATMILCFAASSPAQNTAPTAPAPATTSAPSETASTSPAENSATQPSILPPPLTLDPTVVNDSLPPIGQTEDFLPGTTGISSPDSASSPIKKNEWLIAPIPLYNPTLGGGVILGAGYLFHFDPSDQISPTSTVAAFAGATTNRSWVAGAMSRMYLDEDHYRLTLAFVHADINYDFFGIGNAAARSFHVPVTQTANGMLLQPLFQVIPHLYIGPRYTLGTTSLESQNFPSLAARFPRIAAPFSSQIGALGLVTQWDNTDSQFFPTKGEFLDLTSEFYSDYFGGSTNFQRITFSGEQFLSLADNQVLAFREVAETVVGDAPVYLYPTAGVKGDFRGYQAGRYRDRLLLASQLEYRFRLTDHWGFVLFGSVGEVHSSLSTLSLNDLLPSGGGGIRYRLTRENKINFRFDVAAGKDGAVFYFGVGEAF